MKLFVKDSGNARLVNLLDVLRPWAKRRPARKCQEAKSGGSAVIAFPFIIKLYQALRRGTRSHDRYRSCGQLRKMRR